jgi:hypothetical protein
LYPQDATTEVLDELWILVDPGDLVTEMGEAGGHDQADMATADDGDTTGGRNTDAVGVRR